jgi:beta-glucosidase
VAAVNARTVVAVVAGSAVVVSPWQRRVPAVVQSWYAGMEGGAGLADVLLGSVDAGGRLPFTVPADDSQLPPFDADATAVTYDAWHGWWLLERAGHVPAYPFGFGLSYTSFASGEFAVRSEPGGLVVTGTVRNTGTRPGVDVVQVYGGHEHWAGTGRRSRRLLGFARVEAAPGDVADVVVAVPLAALAVRDGERRRMVVRAGAYRIDVARHAADPAAVHLSVTVGEDVDVG